MKVLLIGPVPPPHGGVSVHVMEIHRRLTSYGAPCLVLDPGQVRSKLCFTRTLARYAAEGWTIHLHTNGHNWKSWMLALWCGLAGMLRGNFRILTLHSGMAPEYLRTGRLRRGMARLACRLYSRIVCVSPAIQDAIVALGISRDRTEVAPACLGTERPDVTLDPRLLSWIGAHRPVLSTALFFRPEYGFDLLVEGMVKLRERYPHAGCVVMGSGEQRAEAAERIRAANLDGHALLAGDVDHEQCLAIMARSNVFLRPTRADGDSISVREALALGVPVVASRVGTRPAGVLLFTPGSVAEMLLQVEQALRAQPTAVSESTGSMDRLLEIYRQADDVREGLCLNLG